MEIRTPHPDLRELLPPGARDPRCGRPLWQWGFEALNPSDRSMEQPDGQRGDSGESCQTAGK
jgi:hypothetical protein